MSTGPARTSVSDPEEHDQSETPKEHTMQHIMIWLKTEAYDRWQAIHDGYAEDRKEFGITEDHVYRDVRDPGAAMVHLVVEDAAKARGWFQTDKFRNGTVEAKVTDRAIYAADRQV